MSRSFAHVLHACAVAVALVGVARRAHATQPEAPSELMPVNFMAAVESEGAVSGSVVPAANWEPLVLGDNGQVAEPVAPAPLPMAPQPAEPVPPPRLPIFDPPVIQMPAWYEAHTCPKCQPWTRGYLGSNYGTICTCNDTNINGFVFDGLVRGYYLNDQRVEWSGMEATFGAEGILIPRLIYNTANGWTLAGNGVFFINQPYDRDMYSTPERQSYLADFQVETFQIWNMNVTMTKGDLKLTVGKDNTPFGRYYFPIFSNSRMDAPFIRTEAINWVETGVFLRYTPSIFSIDLALTNGGNDRDTNSSKAGIARFGIQTENFVCGVSGKYQDGVGSETEKEYNNYYGGDFMIRRGQFDISGEAIYNQYGFKRPYDPNNIFWGRSIYYRDLYAGPNGLSGVGYYINCGYTWPRLRTDLNYGEFYPHPIGNPLADTPIRRAVVKGTWTLIPRLEQYLALIFENSRPTEPFRINQKPYALLTGFQTYF
ncbi:MAG TPA: hypothetical protein VHZ24_15900 [Pirellulales bacterium]|nr:hypothetical protein [Pirellulales bacterium]